jgi:opacity protein-like surface antigen
MKKIMSLFLLTAPNLVHAQFGIKAGLNYANVTKAANINNSSRSGFNIGVFLAPPAKKLIGSRTELIFSRQGYDYKSNTSTGSVNLDYIMLPQYMSVNITKYFSIMLGGQMAFLVNAKVDSSNAGIGGTAGKIMDYYNRFDYGYGGGVEIHMNQGILIGGRFNISLGNLYKDLLTGTPGSKPSFIPNVDVKNNLFQLYAGWQFGRHKR